MHSYQLGETDLVRYPRETTALLEETLGHETELALLSSEKAFELTCPRSIDVRHHGTLDGGREILNVLAIVLVCLNLNKDIVGTPSNDTIVQ